MCREQAKQRRCGGREWHAEHLGVTKRSGGRRGGKMRVKRRNRILSDEEIGLEDFDDLDVSDYFVRWLREK